jgi:RND superfamily putative drug exporter
VAFGVLLDTLLVRSLLVPALTVDVGRAVWWPSALASAPPPVESAGQRDGESVVDGGVGEVEAPVGQHDG